MAGASFETGACLRPGADLVESFQSQWLPAAWPFDHHEHPVGVRVCGTFAAQVVAERGEERVRDRDEPLMASLAVGDEHSPLSDTDVAHP
jgi:hypothetical protein